MLAAAGGAYLSIGFVNSFGENMTAGRGFIALAALIFGNWRPYGAAAACMLFGFSSALGHTAARVLAIGVGPVPGASVRSHADRGRRLSSAARPRRRPSVAPTRSSRAPWRWRPEVKGVWPPWCSASSPSRRCRSRSPRRSCSDALRRCCRRGSRFRSALDSRLRRDRSLAAAEVRARSRASIDGRLAAQGGRRRAAARDPRRLHCLLGRDRARRLRRCSIHLD